MTTRRSARIASSQSQPDSSPPASQSSPASAGKKRKAESGASPSAKRGKKDEKQQISIEESMDVDRNEPEQPKPKSAAQKPEPETRQEETQETSVAEKEDESSELRQTNGHAEKENGQKSEEDAKAEAGKDIKASDGAKDPVPETKEEQDESKQPTKEELSKPAANGEDAVEPAARDGEVPSSILEKGIMYFVYRGRVNIDDPSNVGDIARSYLILRPLPHGAKLSDGPIGDDTNCRLIAVPKKMLPLSGNDRWTAFVEKSNASFSELKESFLQSNDYSTQTGPRHTPAVTPAAEGVYAITTTGRETHLAYIITLPQDLGQVQNDLGLRSRGSFVTSVKNPKAPGPANADIGKDPGYSQELMNEFRTLRWSALKPDHLNYEGCQFLMIGEGEQGLDKAMEPQDGDEKKDETPKEEIEKLEAEDELRVEHLNGNDAIFEDLGTNAKDYPKLQTTW